jgi:flagellar biosynthesis protein FliR
LRKVVTVRIDYLEVARYLTILLRLSLVVFLIPPFSNPRIPAKIKVCFLLGLTTVLFPLLEKELTPLVFQPGALLCVVVSETIFGMLMAVSFYVILGGFELAGELISCQTGLSMAQVVDPQGGFQMTIVSNMIELVALLLFLTFNGHHVILRLIVESFRTIPVGAFILNASTIDRFILFSGQLFLIAIKLAAPVVIVLFLIQIGLGVISKFVPNINVLVTSFPLTIFIGLFFVVLALPYWGEAMARCFNQLFGFMQNIVQLQFPTRW